MNLKDVKVGDVCYYKQDMGSGYFEAIVKITTVTKMMFWAECIKVFKNAPKWNTQMNVSLQTKWIIKKISKQKDPEYFL